MLSAGGDPARITMPTTSFSIIIPSYEMGKFIGSALDSVGAQTCTDWEVIVVEDCGPEDGTERIVKEFATKHSERRVEFIRHEKNTGVSGARNTAIAAATGDFVAFLDPDDLWNPTYLERIATEFEANPKAAVVSSPVEAFYETPNGLFLDPLRFENWQIGRFPASLAVSNFMQPTATVVRRSAVLEIGCFDTNPAIQHIEDYDLWIRLALCGKEFRFINENLTRYRKHEAAATSDMLRMGQLHKILTNKHPGFFIHSQSQMIHLLMAESSKVKQSLKHPLKTILKRIFSK